MCVLVTHQLQYLKDVEHVILLNKGRVEAQGTYNHLKNFEISALLPEVEEELDKEEVKPVTNGQVHTIRYLRSFYELLCFVIRYRQ